MAFTNNRYDIPGLDFGFQGIDPTKVADVTAATSVPNVNTPTTTIGMPGGVDIGGGNSGTSWWDKMMGSKEAGPGWGGTALKAAEGLGNFYLGSQQLGLAKDALATQKRQFADQFNIQKQNINRDIFDQGQARYDRNAALNVDPDTYYEKNRIK